MIIWMFSQALRMFVVYVVVVVVIVVVVVKSATKLQMSMSTYKPLQIQREVKLHAAFLHKSEQEIVDGTLQK